MDYKDYDFWSKRMLNRNLRGFLFQIWFTYLSYGGKQTLAILAKHNFFPR
jgi:hypothetical protein